MSWFVDISNDLAVCLIPRSGNKCIRGWLGRQVVVVDADAKELQRVSRRVAFVRHPIERLQSAYWLFYWMLRNDGSHHISGAPVETWEVFINYLLAGETPYDEHVQPQVELIAGMADTVHRFENLHSTFEKYKPGILPDRGRTTKYPVNIGYRLDELIKFYAEDFALWMESD
jgi:hypothetical protein